MDKKRVKELELQNKILESQNRLLLKEHHKLTEKLKEANKPAIKRHLSKALKKLKTTIIERLGE